MKKILTALFILFFCFDAKAQLRVVPYTNCHDSDGFFISIKNTSAVVKHIKKSELPWMPTSPFIRFSVRLHDNKGSFKPISKQTPVWDTFHDPQLSIAPGQIMSGFIPFNYLIGNFDSKSKQGDIVVLFSIRGESLLPADGIVFLPKRSLFFDRCPAVLKWP